MRSRVDLRVVVALLALLAATASGFAISHRQLTVGSAESATQDVRRFDEDVRVEGSLDGNVVLIGGTLMIAGVIRGDVVTLGTDITFARGGRIEGDLVSIGGALRGFERAVVSGDVVSRGSERSDRGEVTLTSLGQLSRLSMAINFLLLAAWLIATILLSTINGKELRFSSLELRVSPFHTFALGLVAFTSFVLSLVVLSFLIPFGVGVPLIAVVSAIAVCAKIYGMVSVFHAVGSRIFGAKTREEQPRQKVRGDLALAVAGLVILGLIRLIPFLGSFVWMIASIFGVGTALATRFGRREPWFIAVRQVAWRN